MPCSAITLSLATICAVVSAALLAIAFGTDNWQFIKVSRAEIEGKLTGSTITPDAFRNSGMYYTRTKGLFRVCYPEALPLREQLYLSPVETQCQNIDYHIFDEDSDTTQFSDDEMSRLHMARSMIALFIVAFFFMVVAFVTGVTGCWRRSPGNVASTAILMLLACLFAAGGMGLWHGVEYYEEERITTTEPFKGSWDQLLKDKSVVVFDWSYFLAWIGVGWSLVSSLLFFGASVCLRSESEREEAKNMAYLMPVYPQKQQYPNYGYGYPAPAYQYAQPQYGHYNY